MIPTNKISGRLHIVGVAVAILLVVVVMKLLGHRQVPKSSIAAVGTRPAPIELAPSSGSQPLTRVKNEPRIQPDLEGIRQTTKTLAVSVSQVNPTGSTGLSNIDGSMTLKNTKAVTDPWARLALSYVGLDEEATAYWLAAINDASLPSEERKDLIEDLNEDGFRDPEHPAPDEFPLIFNRLMLLEAMAPSAMDEINFAAMAEAFKDLINMARDMGAE